VNTDGDVRGNRVFRYRTISNHFVPFRSPAPVGAGPRSGHRRILGGPAGEVDHAPTACRIRPDLRVDLGLGRAPGTDQRTARALRRDLDAADDFVGDVQEILAWFGPVEPGTPDRAIPAPGTDVPL
jgi:hypothetical protein